jgi:hypothetical protein
MLVDIKGTAMILKPDQSRVLLRSFSPGDPQRVKSIIARIMSLTEDRGGALLNDVCTEFSKQHRQIRKLFLPLLEPSQTEREAYVPNVVYACGALFHKGELLIPYGLADHATRFATVALSEVLAVVQ